VLTANCQPDAAPERHPDRCSIFAGCPSNTVLDRDASGAVASEQNSTGYGPWQPLVCDASGEFQAEGITHDMTVQAKDWSTAVTQLPVFAIKAILETFRADKSV
jgi:hypothetical protein